MFVAATHLSCPSLPRSYFKAVHPLTPDCEADVRPVFPQILHADEHISPDRNEMRTESASRLFPPQLVSGLNGDGVRV